MNLIWLLGHFLNSLPGRKRSNFSGNQPVSLNILQYLIGYQKQQERKKQPNWIFFRAEPFLQQFLFGSREANSI
jgi:hypothetical protein